MARRGKWKGLKRAAVTATALLAVTAAAGSAPAQAASGWQVVRQQPTDPLSAYVAFDNASGVGQTSYQPACKDWCNPVKKLWLRKGGDWKQLPTQPRMAADVLAGTATDDVWAFGETLTPTQTGSGEFHAYYWDGSRWLDRSLKGLNVGAAKAISRNDVWAVGDIKEGDGKRWVAAHWDGSSWSTTELPGDAFGLRAIDVASGKDVWVAGGDYNNRPYAAHWDGTAWREVKLPSSASVNPSAIISRGANDVWIGGDAFPGIESLKTVPVAMHWDGTRWAEHSLPDDTVINTRFNAFAYHNGELWTGLSWGDGATLWRWNGKDWQKTGDPVASLWGANNLQSTADGTLWFEGSLQPLGNSPGYLASLPPAA
ncbi:hypothetical protein ACFY2W_04100 [Streptomyces sp. NPDC001262]|uniref:hypothetical protein n=1 Tax=Streptomyces sp. NPDC001262 TaxID=3364552 RepID=UPI0036C144ED